MGMQNPSSIKDVTIEPDTRRTAGRLGCEGMASGVLSLGRTLNVVARRRRTRRAKRTRELIRRCHPRRVRQLFHEVYRA